MLGSSSASSANVITHANHKISDFRYIYLEQIIGGHVSSIIPTELFKDGQSFLCPYGDVNGYHHMAQAKYKTDTESYLWGSGAYLCKLYGIK